MDLSSFFNGRYNIPQQECENWSEKLIKFLEETKELLSKVIAGEYPQCIYPAGKVKPQTSVIPALPRQIAIAVAGGMCDNPLSPALRLYTPLGAYLTNVYQYENCLLKNLKEIKEFDRSGVVCKEEHKKLTDDLKTIEKENAALKARLRSTEKELKEFRDSYDVLVANVRKEKAWAEELLLESIKTLEEKLKKSEENVRKIKDMEIYIYENIKMIEDNSITELEKNLESYFKITLGNGTVCAKYVKMIKVVNEYIKQLNNGIDSHVLSSFDAQPEEIKNNITLLLELFRVERSCMQDLVEIIKIMKKKTACPIGLTKEIMERYDDVQTICKEMSEKIYKGSIYYKKTKEGTVIFGEKPAVLEQIEHLKAQISHLQEVIAKRSELHMKDRKTMRDKLLQKVENMNTNIMSETNILNYVKHKFYRKKTIENCLTEEEKKITEPPVKFLGIRVTKYIIFLLEEKCLIDVLKMDINNLTNERFKYIIKALKQIGKAVDCKRAIIWFRNHFAKMRNLNQAGKKNKEQSVQDLRFYNTYLAATDCTLEDYLKMTTTERTKVFYKYYKQLDREIHANYLNRNFSKDLKTIIKTAESRERLKTVKAHQLNLVMPKLDLLPTKKPRVNILSTMKKMKEAILRKSYTETTGRSETLALMTSLEVTLLRRYNRHYDTKKELTATSRAEVARDIHLEFERMQKLTEIKATDDDKDIDQKIKERAFWIEKFQKEMGRKHRETYESAIDTSDTSDSYDYDSDEEYF